MKEKSFSIVSKAPAVSIIGGLLWKAPQQNTRDLQSVSLKDKKLCISIYPEHTIEMVISQLRKLTRKTSPYLYLRLVANYLLEPVLLILPAVIIVLVIGLLGAYGNLINELFSLGNGPTKLIVNKYQMFFVYTSFFVFGAYMFPFFFQGDFAKTFSDAKKFLDTNERNRSRILKVLQFLSHQNRYVAHIELWNPGILREGQSWIGETLIPGIIAVGPPVDIYTHVDEKYATRKLIEEIAPHTIEWEEIDLPEEESVRPIALQYLETWEKELLPVMVCASTANVPNDWYVSAEENTEADDAALVNVLSLPLAELLVQRFGMRFFSDAGSQGKASVGVFVNRCLNDYRFLFPVSEMVSNMWIVSPSLVEEKRLSVRAEMNYVNTWLQVNVEEVLKEARDPAAAVILAGTHTQTSVYNERKLLSLEGFITAITRTEQYMLLRKYWRLLSVMKTDGKKENLEVKLFRLIRTQALSDLVSAFRHAGMYEKTGICYDYLRAIYPLDSAIGEGIILGAEGKYKDAIEKMLQAEREWMAGKLSPGFEGKSDDRPSVDPVTQLNLYISLTIIIVMNRISDYKKTAEQALSVMQIILFKMGDGERNNYQLARYYNVLASYYEWESEYEKALYTYEKGLKIPEVDESAISNLLVNMGIAYRMIGKMKSEYEESIYYLKRGVDCNCEGVEAKKVIGNEDQLPVALHNLAETCIELAYRLKNSEEKTEYFLQAYNYSQQGIHINSRIHSVKKTGQLLCERFLAAYWLNQLQPGARSEKAEIQHSFLDWVENKQVKSGQSYDVEVVLDLMSRTDAFAGYDLQSLAEWLRTSRI